MESLSLIKALGPAFAAGFAVQRLLEILDPLVEKAKNKKAILGVASLIAGLILAFAGKLRVLLPLGTDIGAVLDYLVTGLVISAGTEGINSVLKFLTYKKEEKKAEAATEKTQALRSVNSAGGLMSAPALESTALSSLSSLTDVARIIEPGMDNAAAIKKSLRLSIIQYDDWEGKFSEDEWEETPFSVYTQDEDDGKVVVVRATRNVANELGFQLRDDIVRDLQIRTKLDTKPSDIMPHMVNALHWPA